MPLAVIGTPPMAMTMRSMSHGSSLLPIAATMRPQLASSPAIAVLTSGELATARPMRLALPVVGGARDADLDELGGALAVLHHLMGKIEHDLVELGAEVPEVSIGWPP